ncbi:MAG: capsular polysaccharide synthesis protein [Treponema sp.]|jgi:hypothetical protein|nr:capsular polysaccharide synthesis protein [Treponema sp.]
MKQLNKIIYLFDILLHKSVYYGPSVACWDFLNSQRRRLGLFADFVNDKKHSAIVKWLTIKFQFFISEFVKQYTETIPLQCNIPEQIWICWWDGIDTMPPLVRACYNSVNENAGKNNIHLITKNNFHEFVSIPNHILNKFNLNIISRTHLSDILRMALLAEHGGLWLDATVFVTGSIQSKNDCFFTIKRDYVGEYVSKRRWTGFCIGGTKNNILFEFAKNFFYEYWKKYNDMIDYFLIDYVIDIAYRSISGIKQMIDNVPLNNSNLYVMRDNLGNEAASSFLDEICENTIFHKLTWKQNYPIRTPEEKLTFYGFILGKHQ